MTPPDRPVVTVTGAGGFVGRNLVVRLRERGLHPRCVLHETPADVAANDLAMSDVIFHLAGANRPDNPADFLRINRDFAAWAAEAIAAGGRKPLVVLSSSIRADGEDDYGRSKRAGEERMLALAAAGAATVAVYRLPNIFGKWSRPDYNSVVATYCHNLARDLPIRIDRREAPLSLLYIDDLIDQWLDLIDGPPVTSGLFEPFSVHRTTVGEVADWIRTFAAGRRAGYVGPVGTGLARALYATFISFLPDDAFTYPLTSHGDARGLFSEMLKTPDCGQFSFFSTLPGATRGGHYHHSKVEKFLVVHGEALFRFRHIVSGAEHWVQVSAARPTVVETIPGWTHDVTNVGEDMMVSLLWANELFQPDRPDTIRMPL